MGQDSQTASLIQFKIPEEVAPSSGGPGSVLPKQAETYMGAGLSRQGASGSGCLRKEMDSEVR